MLCFKIVFELNYVCATFPWTTSWYVMEFMLNNLPNTPTRIINNTWLPLFVLVLRHPIPRIIFVMSIRSSSTPPKGDSSGVIFGYRIHKTDRRKENKFDCWSCLQLRHLLPKNGASFYDFNSRGTEISRKFMDWSHRSKIYEFGQHPHATSFRYSLVVHFEKELCLTKNWRCNY